MHPPVTEIGLGALATQKGESVHLWPVPDFERWWYAMEERFVTPVGRKLLYAVCDAEEHLLQQRPNLSHRWYRRKHSMIKELANRRTVMGWGRFDHNTEMLHQPAHSLVDSGSALAHREHLQTIRFNMTWQQHNEGAISLSFQPKLESMASVCQPQTRMWSCDGCQHEVDGSLDVEFSPRDVGFFVNEHRHFLLPTSALTYLFSALLSVEGQTASGPPGLVVQGVAPDESTLFSIIAGAAYDAVMASHRLVFFDSVIELQGVLRAHLHRLGFGGVEVERFHDCNNITLRVTGEHTPLLVGWTYALIRMGSGGRLEALVTRCDDHWELRIQSEKVSFPTA